MMRIFTKLLLLILWGVTVSQNVQAKGGKRLINESLTCDNRLAKGSTFTTENISQRGSIIEVIVSKQLNCDGTALISIKARGGTRPYKYSLSHTFNASDEAFGSYQSDSIFVIPQNSFPNTGFQYKVRVKDANDVIGYASDLSDKFELVIKRPLEIGVISKTNPTSTSSSDGSIKLSIPEEWGTVEVKAKGANGSLGANWIYKSGSIYNLKADSYILSAKAGYTSGITVYCSAERIVTLSGPLSVSLVNKVHPTTETSTDGSITVTASGGTGTGYSYILNGVNKGSSSTLAGLSNGDYTLVVKDSEGNLSPVLHVRLGIIPLTVSLSMKAATCGSSGAINVVPVGGSGTYVSYFLNDGEEFPFNNGTDYSIYNLSPGDYHIAIKDSEGNISPVSNNATVDYIAPAQLTLSVSNASGGNANGSVQISVQGQSNDGYHFYIDDTFDFLYYGATGSVFSNLAAGRYNVFAEKGGCYSQSYSFNVYDSSAKVQALLYFPEPGVHAMEESETDLSISSNVSDFPVSVISSDPSIVSVSKVDGIWRATLHRPGTVTITASQNGNDYILSAESIARTLTVRGAAVIDFPEIPSKTFADLSFNLNATSNNTETPLYYQSSDPSVISVANTSNGWVATINKVGSATISAIQDESTSFTGSRVDREVVVSFAQRKSVINFPNLPAITEMESISSQALFPISPNSTSEGALSSNNTQTAIVLTSSNPALGKITKSGSRWYVTAYGSGTITVTATQVGNANYLAADPVVRTLLIKPGIKFIPFASITPSEETGMNYIPFYNGDYFEKTSGLPGDPNLKYVDVSFKLTRKVKLARLALSSLNGGSTYPISIYVVNEGQKRRLDNFNGTLKLSGLYNFSVDSSIVADEIILHKYANNMPNWMGVYGYIIEDSPVLPIKSEIHLELPTEFNLNDNPFITFQESGTAWNNNETPILVTSSDASVLEVTNDGGNYWRLTPLKEGASTLTVSQTGNGKYAQALDIVKTVTVNAADNRQASEIYDFYFSQIASDSTFTLSAKSNNTESPLIFSSSDPSILKIYKEGEVWKAKGLYNTGVNIIISQDGNSHFKPAYSSDYYYVDLNRIWGDRLKIAEINPTEDTGMDYFSWWYDELNMFVQNTTGANDPNQKWIDISLKLTSSAHISKVALYDVEGEFPAGYATKVYASNGSERRYLGEFKGSLTNKFYEIFADTSFVADEIIIHKFGNYIPQKVQIFGFSIPDSPFRKIQSDLRIDIPDTAYVGQSGIIDIRTNGYGNVSYSSSDPLIFAVAPSRRNWNWTAKSLGEITFTAVQSENEMFSADTVSKKITVVNMLPPSSDPAPQRISIASIDPQSDGLNYYPWWFDDVNYLVKLTSTKNEYSDVILKLTQPSNLSKISLYDAFGEFSEHPVSVYASNNGVRTLLGTFTGALNNAYVDIKANDQLADAIIIHKYGNYIPQKVQVFGFPQSSLTVKIKSEFEQIPAFPILYSGQTKAIYIKTSTGFNNKQTGISILSSDTTILKIQLAAGKAGSGTWNGIGLKEGTVTVTISQPGNDNYLPSQTFSIPFSVLAIPTKGTSTITFNKIPDLHLSEDKYTLTATSTNTETPITYTSSDLTVASVVTEAGMAKLALHKIGNVTITASQAGNDNFDAAQNVTASLTIKAPIKKDPVITFAELTEKFEGDAPFALSASSTNTQTPIGFVSSDSTVVSVSKTTGTWLATIQKPGTVTITAKQDSNLFYNAASLSRTLVVKGKIATVINIPTIEDKALQDYVFYIDVSSNNTEAPVTLELSDPSILTISNSPESPTWKRVVMVKRGTVTIKASQPETTNFKAATLSRTFSIKDAAGLNFASLPERTNNDTSFDLIASSNHSEAPIVFTSSEPAIVSVSDSTGKWRATIKRLGSAIITASQASSAHYASAQASQKQTVVRSPLAPQGGQRLVIASAVGSINTGQDYAPLINDDPNDVVKEVYNNENKQYVDVVLSLAQKSKLSRLSLEDRNGTMGHPVTVYARNGSERIQLGIFTGIYGQGEYFDINVDTSIVADAIILNKYENDLPRKVQAYGYAIQSDTTEVPVQLGASIKFNEIPDKTNADLPFELYATSNNTETDITFVSSNADVVSLAKSGGKWIATIHRTGTVTIIAKQAGNANYLPAVDVSRNFTIQKVAPAAAGERLTFASAVGSVYTGQEYAPLINDDLQDLVLPVYTEDNNKQIDVVLTLTGKAKLTRVSLLDDWGPLDAHPVKVYSRKGSERIYLGSFNGPYGAGEYFDINVADTSAVVDAIILEKFGNSLPLKVQAYGFALPQDTTSVPVAVSTRINFPEIGNKTNNDAPFELLVTSNNTETGITFESSNPLVVSVAKVDNKWIATIKRLGAVTITAKQEASQNYLAAVPVSRNITIARAVLAPLGGERLVIASAIANPLTGQDYAPLINDNLNDRVGDVYSAANNKYVDVKLTLQKKARLSRVTFVDKWGDLTQYPITVFAEKAGVRTFLGTYDGPYGEGGLFDINIDTSIVADAIILYKYGNLLPFKVQAYGYVLPSDSTDIPVAVGSSIRFDELPGKTNNDASFQLIASSNNTDTEITFESSNPDVVSISKVNQNWIASIKRLGSVTITAKQAASVNFLEAPEVARTLSISRAVNAPQGGTQLEFISAGSTVNTGQNFTPLINNDLSDKVDDVWGNPVNKQYIDVTLTLKKRSRISRITIPDDWRDFRTAPVKVFALKDTTRTLLGIFESLYGLGDFYDINVDTSVVADAIVIQKYENNVPLEIHAYGYTLQDSAKIAFASLAGKLVGDAPFQLKATSNNTETEITFSSSDPTIVSVTKVSNAWFATIHKQGMVNIVASQLATTNYSAGSVSRSLTIGPEIISVMFGEDPLCYETKGRIYVSAIGGSGKYTYSLNGSAFQDSSKFTGLDAGVYTVKVKDSNGQETRSSDTIRITLPPALKLDLLSKKNPTVNGAEDGLIRFKTSGGNGAISYSVNGAARDTATTLDSLTAGTYVIVAKDTSECSASLTVQLTEPPVLSISVETVSPTCYQDTVGIITVNATGGVPPYQYAVHPVYIDSAIAFQNTNVFPNRGGGDYVAYVKDAFGGIRYVSGTLPQPNPVTAQIKVVNPACATEKGYIMINAKGGSGKYEYSINSLTDYRSDPLFRDLDSGLYVIRTRDSNGCMDIETQTVEITRPEPVKLMIKGQKVLNSDAYSNGSLQVSAKGGKGYGYMYFIKEGENDYLEKTASYFNTLGTGTYTIFAVDSNYCTSDSVNISLIDMPKLVVSASHTNETCFSADNGSINISVSGGMAPYYYSIDSGQTFSGNRVFSQLKAGKYWLRIKDSAELTDTLSIVLTEPSEVISVVSLSSNSTGAKVIKIKASGGHPPYTYSVDNSVYGPDSTFVDVGFGPHLISVKDKNDCLSSLDSIRIDADSLKFSHIITKSLPGKNNGTIYIYAAGGRPPYIYGIERLNSNAEADTLVQNFSQFKELKAGTYNIWVKDFTGAVYSVIDSVTTGASSLAISTNIYPASCSNGAGSICIKATGGAGPYYYGVERIGSSAEEDNLYSNYYCFSGLKPGAYNVWVKDEAGVKVSRVDTIKSAAPLRLKITKSFTFVAQVMNPNSSNHSDVLLFYHGAYRLAVEGVGGAGGYSYQITSDDGTLAEDSGSMNSFSNDNTWTVLTISTNKYILTVKDASGCTESIEFIPYPPAIVFADISKVKNESCYGEEDGSVELYIKPGGFFPTDTVFYSLDGINFKAEGKFTNLKVGNYMVHLKDNGGNNSSLGFTIGGPDKIELLDSVITNVSCFGEADGRIKINAKGGLGGPYTYSWMGLPQSEGLDSIANLKRGTYTVLITDEASKCSVYKNFTITEPADIDLTHVNDTLMCAGQVIKVTAKNEGSNYRWQSISKGLTLSQARELEITEADTYELTVTKPNGCIKTKRFKVEISADAYKADFLVSSGVSVGDTVILVNITKPSPPNSQWQLPQSGITEVGSNETGSIKEIVFNQEGDYTISMGVSVGTCVTSMTKRIHVYPKEQTVSVDNNLGYKDPMLKNIGLYPNPTSGEFVLNLELREAQDVEVQLLSSNNMVQEPPRKDFGKTTYKISFDRKDLNPGMYFLIVKIGGTGGIVKTIKIIKI